MRKRVLLTCIALLAICLLLLVLKSPGHRQVNLPISGQTLTNQAIQAKQLVAPGNAQSASVPNVNPPPPPPTQVETSNLAQRELEAWQKPIDFYGKVIDQNSNTVAGARIAFQWVDTPFGNGTRTSNAESDADGSFSLHNKRGPSLEVWVSKEGYYVSHHGQWGFSYTHGNGKYIPDSLNPVIFLLHKKGQGSKLITSDNGMRPNVWVRVPKDNTTVYFDFFQKQAGATGQLAISQNKPPLQMATNWSFALSIPDGGLIENQDEFQFEAPDTNYSSTVEYDFTKGETNWTTQVSKQFYFEFGQPRKYGWLRIESNLIQETVFLTYVINPTGSQNLEPIQ